MQQWNDAKWHGILSNDVILLRFGEDVMKFSACPALIALCTAALPIAGHAAEQSGARPEIFRKLVDCRAISDDARRLACYDAQVAALDSAEAKKDVVVVDKTQIRKAKKTLFGLSLPTLSILGGNDEDKGKIAEEDEVNEIESTIKDVGAAPGAPNRWVIVIEDGARWVQTESRQLTRSPKPGMPIRIRKAAMGSYFANIDGQRAVRVRREN